MGNLFSDLETRIEEKKSELRRKSLRTRSEISQADRALTRRRAEASEARTEEERKELARQIVVLQTGKLRAMARRTHLESRIAQLDRLLDDRDRTELEDFLDDVEDQVEEPDRAVALDDARVDEEYTSLFTKGIEQRMSALRGADTDLEERYTNLR